MTPEEYQKLENSISRWAIEKTEFMEREEEYKRNRYKVIGIAPKYYVICFAVLFFIACN